MRGVIAAVLMSSLVVGSSFAAAADMGNQHSGNLAPGKPAGVAGAQTDNTNFYVITSALLLVGVATFLISTDHSSTSPLVLSSGNNLAPAGGGSSPVSTGSTP